MKKSKLMTVAAVAGSVLLISSIVSFAAAGSGYQSFKKAAQSTMYLENATTSCEAQLKDNGKIIMSGSSLTMSGKQTDKGSSYYSINHFVVDGKTHISESSSNSRQMISRVNDEYYSYGIDPEDAEEMESYSEAFDENSSTVKFAELVVDTLVGDIKNQFVKDGDTITLNLESAQIPELARLGISAVFENIKLGAENQNLDETSSAMFERIPVLETINVESIDFKGTLENGILADIVSNVVITGTDAQGAFHEVEISLTVKETDIGTTVPKTIDTTGKDVTTMDASISMEALSTEVKSMYENGASPAEIEARVKELEQ